MKLHSTRIKFFEFNHLPLPMRDMSRQFHDLAIQLQARNDYVDSVEFEEGMRKLIEAKDCFVRALVPSPTKE